MNKRLRLTSLVPIRYWKMQRHGNLLLHLRRCGSRQSVNRYACDDFRAKQMRNLKKIWPEIMTPGRYTMRLVYYQLYQRQLGQRCSETWFTQTPWCYVQHL